MLDVLDKGNCSARLFFADFKKGSDLTDHRLLLQTLSTFDLYKSLLRWIAAFLQGRSQHVRILTSTSTELYLNGEIQQGTKLGPILFAVMVNDLVSSWGPRAKFVDDLTVLEIVQMNSPSLINCVVNELNAFAQTNNMRLNPSCITKVASGSQSTSVVLESSLSSPLSYSVLSSQVT